MAHFAQLDDNNVVLQVIVVSDENEANGEQWCHEFAGGRWKQTSYNSRIRKNYAGIGFIYDEQRDAFIPPKPFPSWTLNEETCRWEAPIAVPDDQYRYRWSESMARWIPIDRWLFENYGLTQDYSTIAATVEKYGLEDRKLVKVIDKPEYVLHLEKANNILFVHVRIPIWTADIKKQYQADIDALHKEIGTEIYTFSGLDSTEQEERASQFAKFIELFGFNPFEQVTLADGLRYAIFKRDVPTA